MEATIGQDLWKKDTIQNIKLAQAVVQRSDKFNELGRQLDPLPSLRDNCIQQSNAEIHSYMRSARAVVIKLRDNLLNTEEVIKSFLKSKEKLETALEHLRKDILLNEQCRSGRHLRPLKEQKKDGCDDLLAAEKKTLLKLKRILESKLSAVQQTLQYLDNARKRLKAVLSERNRVLDLICRDSASARILKAKNIDHQSLPAELEVNPLGPYTPEAAQAVAMATNAVQKSQALLRDVEFTIDETRAVQRDFHKSVNNGLTKKVAETVAMKQHLQLTSGENRMAIHRGNRWHYTTAITRGYTLGPVSASDLTTRERLDRPQVKCYQRHPGTHLKEAQHIIEGNHGLDASLQAVERNIGMLKLTEDRLKTDIHDKHRAAGIDSSIVRHRRRQANHRWVVGGLSC
ncbi:tektin-like protein 1 [Clytia hemisphaerica]|uniref:Tektin n=1 Tax=Clytia hemisphaerica TaxID=252671 RepID=A0A7M5XI03_9CNID|eukprot:TCONS_00035241-protein